MVKRARVKEFKTLRAENGVYVVEVIWNDGDSTREPLKHLIKDNLKEYLNSSNENNLVRDGGLNLQEILTLWQTHVLEAPSELNKEEELETKIGWEYIRPYWTSSTYILGNAESPKLKWIATTIILLE